MPEVVIAGAGPTGLMLAYELRLAGLDVLLVDSRPHRHTQESRAGGIHARTMEVLDQRGILDGFLAEGTRMPRGHFSGLWMDYGHLDTRYPSSLMLLQHRIERLLEQRVAALGVPVRWSTEVAGLSQDETGVRVELAGHDPVRAAYLVGCDGGRSTVRKLAAIDFPGTPATMTALLGDVELADPPDGMVFMRRTEHGDFSVVEFEPGWHRVITGEYDHVATRDTEPTLDDLRASLIRMAGTDFGMHSPRWVSRFGDAARLATDYRRGRVLLAGDAAHIHFPAGGQGLNLGVQDAANLGWKLAMVLAGHAHADLLDTYQAERRPVAARVLENTRAQSALLRPGPHTDALRSVLANLIDLPDVTERLGNMITALDIRYPLGDGHPLVGYRVPDADLTIDGRETRLFTLLHHARPVLLDLTGMPDLPAAANGWTDRVGVVRARCARHRWSIPGGGEVAAPSALLVRPDGHVAWAAGRTPDLAALRTALTTWCGESRAESPEMSVVTG